MWKYLFIVLAVGMASCSGAQSGSSTSTGGADSNTMPTPDLRGQWLIENVVESDSSYVRPSEITPDVTPYIDFKDDHTFGVTTGCNHLSGHYSQSGDTLRLTDISWTELACDHMELEEMLKKVLPQVRTIDCLNDSVTRLNSADAPSYIVLCKPSHPVK